MTRTAWTLSDVERDEHVDSLHITAGEVGAAGDFSIRKRTLRGGLREGVEVVEVDNGLLRFTVVPTRGMGLWRVELGDLRVGWLSPVLGPVHPQFVPVAEPSGIGWLAGFDELLCRCGLESNGAPQFGDDGRLQYPLHGRIANLPAQRVEAAIDTAAHAIAVEGTVDEARLFGHKLRLHTTYLTQLDQPRLRIVDRVTNLSSEPSNMELLYHINFGPPLATPGARIVAPIETLAPRDMHSATDVARWSTLGPATAGLPEYAHFAELVADGEGRTRVMLVAADGQRGVSLQFNRHRLPAFTIWKSQRLPEDGYVTGLEPGTNYPNVKRFEQQQGRVPQLDPGQTLHFEIDLEVHPTAESVNAAAVDIANIARGVEPTIRHEPMPGWSDV
ncbi:MAG TPA: aldose 1-epimerase family protein [Pirellulales bacterium]|jgi:galactose mutarotase-like enzyme|nr:aldose 1-epimerase family protein [Pirellulales bacterium]